MARNYPRGKYGHKPSKPVYKGNTRSTFDGCAVVVLGALGLISGIGYAIVKVVS